MKNLASTIDYYPPSNSSIIEKVRHLRLSRINAKHFSSKKIVFIHIPRAAGSYISNALYGRALGHLYGDYIVANVLRAKDISSFRFVSFVRCPVDRLISAYAFSCTRGTQFVRQWRLYQPPSKYLLTFTDFCRKWLFLQDPASIDYIFRPQYWWIISDYNCQATYEIHDYSLADQWLEYQGLARPAPSARNSSCRHHRMMAINELNPALIDEIKRYYSADYSRLQKHFISRF
jgi:hypothetical protein